MFLTTLVYLCFPGRQVKGTPIEGFPNGLPDLTPLGVRITLENMIGICLLRTLLALHCIHCYRS